MEIRRIRKSMKEMRRERAPVPGELRSFWIPCGGSGSKVMFMFDEATNLWLHENKTVMEVERDSNPHRVQVRFLDQCVARGPRLRPEELIRDPQANARPSWMEYGTPTETALQSRLDRLC